MATRNIVPRGAGEGQLGTVSKPWDKVNAITGSFTAYSGSIAGQKLTLVSGSVASTGSFGRIFAAGDIYATGEVSADSFVSRDGSETISFQDDVAFGADDSITSIQNITATGNISSSASSTGSFGDVMVANNLALGGDPIYNVGTTGANLTITANNPYINLNDSNSTSGTRVFSIGSDNNKLKFAKMTDDGGTKVEQFLMNGNGNFSMGAGAGNLVEHANSTGGNLTLDGNNPALNLYDNNASSGARNKAILSMGGALYIGKTADNGTSAVHHIVIDDSGNVEVPVGNISGSSTSTGSFGYLTVAGLSNPNLIDFSSSLSTRITNDSSSFSTRITADSSSFSTRITADSSSFSTRITADSSSFSSRTTFLEGTGEIQSLGTTNNVLFANITASGDVIVQGKLTAQEIHTEIESASVIFTSGSTLFGNTSDDLHRFTGSVSVTENVSLQSNIIISGNITASNNISASGDILADGRIFEKGTSVIDHATAMSIVFGG